MLLLSFLLDYSFSLLINIFHFLYSKITTILQDKLTTTSTKEKKKKKTLVRFLFFSSLKVSLMRKRKKKKGASICITMCVCANGTDHNNWTWQINAPLITRYYLVINSIDYFSFKNKYTIRNYFIYNKIFFFIYFNDIYNFTKDSEIQI